MKQAIKKIKAIAEAENFDRVAYRAAEKDLVDAGICPSCAANDGITTKLMKWEPGNSENYAGRECPLCEEFFRCGEQLEYDAGPDCFSDADSGL